MTLGIDKDSGAAMIAFKGRPGILDIQRVLMDAIDLIIAEKRYKAVIDTSQLEVMFTLSLYWYRKEWYPLANKSGLKAVAVILPKDFAQGRFLQRLNNTKREASILFHFYTEKEAAINWIKTIT